VKCWIENGIYRNGGESEHCELQIRFHLFRSLCFVLPFVLVLYKIYSSPFFSSSLFPLRTDAV